MVGVGGGREVAEDVGSGRVGFWEIVGVFFGNCVVGVEEGVLGVVWLTMQPVKSKLTKRIKLRMRMIVLSLFFSLDVIRRLHNILVELG